MEKKTNGMSIAAIILAFIFPVVGLILAIVAKKKDSEDKLAKTAFVISLIMVILGVIGTIGCFGCSACMMASSDTSESTPQTTTAITEKVETEKIETTVAETEPAEKVFTVGDTIQTKKYKFTLTNAINSNIIEGKYNQEAPEGKTYIVLFFEVENISDKDEYILFYEAYIDDYSADETYLLFIDDEPFSGDIAAGKKLKGYVAYEADEDWKELEWKYDEYGDDSIEFVIHPEDIK